MASSKNTEDSSFRNLTETDRILSQLYKVSSEEIPHARKCVKSLPLICQLLRTGIDLNGSQFKLCMEMLNMTLQRLFSILVYSQDWNAVEALFILMNSQNIVTTDIISDRMLLEKNYTREFSSCTSLLNVRQLDMSLTKSIQHALNLGSTLPLNILLNIIGYDFEKRNSTFGPDASTLLHLACLGAVGSKFPLLPVWLLGCGIDSNITNKEGKLPVDLLPDESAMKLLFKKLSTNRWIKDLAYMDYDAVKQFILQQLCTCAQWLNLRHLVGELGHLTGADYSKTLLALEGKRWNTACKSLLDATGVCTEGLSALKTALLKSCASEKRDLFLTVINTVAWRLRYETLGTPYVQPKWLEDLAAENVPHEISVDTRKESMSVRELMQSSLWYQKQIGHEQTSKDTPKSVRKRQSSINRIKKSDTGDESSYASFEREICGLVKPKQNAAVFLPHAPSHVLVATEVLKKYFSEKNSELASEDCSGDNINSQEKSGIQTDTGETEISHVLPTEKSRSESTIKDDDLSQESSISFYKQRRKRRARQRQRNNTVSEETVAVQPKLEYKKKHRRRTKSSSDSLAYLEDDISGIKTDITSLHVDDSASKAVPIEGVLVILPSSKAMANTVPKFRSLLTGMTIAEHGGTSRSKAGIRRLLRCNQVVVSHLPALRNSIKAKSFFIEDVSLIIFLDIFYADDLFLLLPKKLNAGPNVVMIFKEFPYRSDICSLESVLQHVRTKIGVETILCVNDNKDSMLTILHPDVTYSSDVCMSMGAPEIVSTLRGILSTVFGTYGEINGCIFVVNMIDSTEDFLSVLSEECLKILPSTFKVHLAETNSRGIKQELYFASTGFNFKPQTSDKGVKRCNFAAFVTQISGKVYVETVHTDLISQLCIDQLHCQQYIRVL